MRILSKYKDYYDYYSGIFGIDNKKVYDRRNMVLLEDIYIHDNCIQIIVFAICGKLYYTKYYSGNMYITSEELAYLDIKTHVRSRYNKTSTKDRVNDFISKNGTTTNINEIKREPVLFGFAGSYWYNSDKIEWNDEIPLLSSFDFHKALDAKEIYTQIETFLGWLVDNPPIKDNMTNTEKILSHGFSLKQSFRHRKKT